MNLSLTLPPSTTPKNTVLAGVVGAFGAAVCISLGWCTSLSGTLLLMLACGVPMWWLEIQRLPASKLTAEPIAPWRQNLRLLGLLVVIVLFAAVYTLATQVLTIFSRPDVLGDMLFVLVAASVPWALWMLRRRARGIRFDCLELLGSAVVLRLFKKRKLKERHFQAFLGWCVKAYFLPLMIGGCYFFTSSFYHISEDINFFSVISLYSLIFYFLYAIDTAFATIGYFSTSRRINGYIRSTDATILGWTVTMVCYPPLNLFFLQKWLAYKDGYEWHEWLADKPLILAMWGGAILLLTTGYVWSTVSFGLRFSNLSYRGLVSSGPYKYFKHPAYLFKNISWWLISIPFISLESGGAAIVNCLGLISINCIYALRAWTEERHLALDPDYRAYSAWMAEFGVFGRFRRLIGC